MYQIWEDMGIEFELSCWNLGTELYQSAEFLSFTVEANMVPRYSHPPNAY